MKTRLLLPLVCSVITFASPVSAQQQNTSDQELRQVADGLARKLDEAWNNNDAAAAAALYADDGVHASFYQTSHGRQAIEKSYAHDFQHWHPSNHVITVDRVAVAGNGVRATGRWSESHVSDIGNVRGSNAGYVTLVIIKEGNTWKIHKSAFTENHGPFSTN
jgi:uncharacterized protein (TIGR02246 family)